MQQPQWFEDFDENFIWEHTIPGLSAEEIIAFAERYDPQRFHLSDTAARETHFGGLVASGFQTQLECFKPLCEQVFKHAHGVGSPGLDSLKWLRPWYPEEALAIRVKLISQRRSSKHTDRGYLGFELTARVDGHPTLFMSWTVIMLTRESGLSA